ncbi:hypothetical protein FA09DRAFT_294029 [Tilletiopsis washingtonensis]|uniref:Photolyase/cryptochrome alpha/beta domain-containing protein n=1 Tax=Tilletiopsis washingtonensis TaxID=58919 RepID=A0A316ZFH3_9BASI|nr:hypothetical protein FA09DRAFT_294029 [Tilletiopsis washingtonensis]PWO00508.1 hypothetical protein FA09DRAFT_294029 [Tilletiopsis washingtonensis]
MEKLGRRPEGAVRHVVYWMRMRDMRIEDNRALALASELVQQGGKGSHLIVLHVLSPGDFAAHDRSPRRIDFVLRTLAKLREQLAELDIPLYVTSHNERKKIPHRVLELCNSWGVSDITGNIEHEVDELWRDIATVQQGPKAGVHPHFVEDTYVVPPGAVKTNDGRPYSVFSPWNRRWTEHLSKHPELLDESPLPERNDASIRKDSKLGKLFEQEVPEAVPGFECEDREYMHKLWPAGSDAARRVLELFIGGKKGQMDFEADATGVDQPMTDDGAKDSKIAAYGTARNILSEHGTSRLSPYLSAGVISARACLRASRDVTKGKLQIGRDSGPAMWGVEVAFRDFYGHVLSAWPRVCMSRAYLLKYEDVKWEYDDEKLKAWMAGRTGYPIVDAAQRQGAKQGYMHNRGRMIVAMFLTKHLMQDWRLGEAYFMRSFIDGDFASNNGGWQWSASTGTDPQPYFRIFAPLSQSEKSDPQGEYIRHWVPELRHVKGNAVHAPYERLSKAEFEKLGYPKPIVDHKQARERALRRFKNPGEE